MIIKTKRNPGAQLSFTMGKLKLEHEWKCQKRIRYQNCSFGFSGWGGEGKRVLKSRTTDTSLLSPFTPTKTFMPTFGAFWKGFGTPVIAVLIFSKPSHSHVFYPSIRIFGEKKKMKKIFFFPWSFFFSVYFFDGFTFWHVFLYFHLVVSSFDIFLEAEN